jgi:hypothetical protein
VVKLDFVVRKDTEYRREEFARRRRIRIEDEELSLVAPQDLIISKLDSARQSRSEVQLGDVRNVLASVPNLDAAHLAHWTGPSGSRGSVRRGATVTDTPPDVARAHRGLLLQRSGEERLKMGCSMHAAARRLVLASILEREPDASPATRRRWLFLRLCGHEFDGAARARILAALERGQDTGARAGCRSIGTISSWRWRCNRTDRRRTSTCGRARWARGKT